MPKIQQTLSDVFVRSHTFKFISPAKSRAEKIPNACTECHKDKSLDWAAGAMKKWKDVSPWRNE
jgi:hypothetical protein